MENVSSKVQAKPPPKTTSTLPTQGNVETTMPYPRTHANATGAEHQQNPSAQAEPSKAKTHLFDQQSGPCRHDREIGLPVGAVLVPLAVVPAAGGESLVPQRNGVLPHPRGRQ